MVSKRPKDGRPRSELNQRLAVDARQLGAMLGLSVRTIRAMDAAGKLPRPVRLSGRSVRWIVSEIENWLSCASNGEPPNRVTWEAMKANAR